MFKIFCVLLVLGLRGVSPYPGGAPSSACVHILPKHGYPVFEAQTTPSPFNVYLSSATYSPGQLYEVAISSNESPFNGWLLQVRPAVGEFPSAVGQFVTAPNGARITSCNGQNNSLTHSNGYMFPNNTLRATWRAPQEDVGDLILWGTVLKDYSTFWGPLKSNPIVFSFLEVEATTVATTSSTQQPTTIPNTSTTAGTTSTTTTTSRTSTTPTPTTTTTTRPSSTPTPTSTTTTTSRPSTTSSTPSTTTELPTTPRPSTTTTTSPSTTSTKAPTTPQPEVTTSSPPSTSVPTTPKPAPTTSTPAPTTSTSAPTTPRPAPTTPKPVPTTPKPATTTTTTTLRPTTARPTAASTSVKTPLTSTPKAPSTPQVVVSTDTWEGTPDQTDSASLYCTSILLLIVSLLFNRLNTLFI